MASFGKATRPKKKREKQKKITPPGPGGNRTERDHHQIYSLVPTISKPDLLDEDGKSDRTFRQMLYDFSLLAAQLEFARAHIVSQVDFTSPQYNIAMIIAYYQGETGVSVSEVAQHLHVTTAFITSEVGKLEKMGLVEKRQNPSDGRGILLRLTPASNERLQQIGPQRLLINDHLFRGLSGEDFRHLARTLASLIDEFADTVNMLKAMRKTQSYRLEKLTPKRK